MPDLNHTKSILYYKEILESFEEQYRDATTDERDAIIVEISGQIKTEADSIGATVAEEEARRKVSIFLVL